VRHHFLVHGFCQMTNHYHLILETAEANLSRGMRHLNGLYSQYFNRRHGVVGHLFQGRYNAILVQKESYLLELTRYVVLNPMRAGVIASLDEWPWSSHLYVMSDEPAPFWLQKRALLGRFGDSHAAAVRAYLDFVMAGVGAGSPLCKTCHQLLLGDEEFVRRHQTGSHSVELTEIPKVQRQAVALSLNDYQALYRNKKEAIARAYLSRLYSMSRVAAHFQVSCRSVSRFVAAFEARQREKDHAHQKNLAERQT